MAFSSDSGMVTDEFQDIESVVVEPEHCHRCGTAVERREFEGRAAGWCPSCELVLSRNPIPAVHVVVHGDGEVLLLDEPIPQHEGVLSLPGGHARHDESPEAAVLRELHEETGLRADPEDLRFVTVIHAETADAAFYFLTYALARSAATGELRPETEGFEVAFRPVDEVLSATDHLRANDRERIELALA